MPAQDPWAGFPDAEGSQQADPWAGFPDAEPKKKKKKKGGMIGRNAPDIPERFSDPVATDGDTIRDGDFRLRLQGIDAPEINQLGYNADGSTVPLGAHSQRWLDEQVYSPENLRMAAQAPPSFGRAVAPLLNNGQDVGLASLRAGQSFAAPDYIPDDQMRFDYLEAQRLARQNRLGVHGSVTVTPDEFRADPDYVPERKETALWFDMPTPELGLTSEQEQRLNYIQRQGTRKEFEDYAESVGWRVNKKQAADWFAYRDRLIREGGDLEQLFSRRGWNYTQAPRPLIDPGDGQLGAAARSYVGGNLIGALDELGAGVDTLGFTPGRENIWNSDRRFGDVYWNNLDQNQSMLAYDEANYPVTTTVGDVAGSITGGFLLPYSAGARTAPQLARVGAAYGGASGFLGTDGSVADRLTGAAIGSTIGFVADPALGKAVDAVLPAASRFAQSIRGGREAAQPPLPTQAAPFDPLTAEGVDVELMERVARDTVFGGETTPATATDDLWSPFIEGELILPNPESSRGAFAFAEEGMADRAMAAYRDMVAQGMKGDPSLGPEDFRPFSDYLAEWRDTERAAIRGNAAARSMVEHAIRLIKGNGAIRPRPVSQKRTRSQLMASASTVQPGDVLPMPSNVPEAGELASLNASRFEALRPVDERTALERYAVTNWRGQPVPKVGPLDLVGFLRTQGGLRDQGGELTQMGLNNAARRGMDHVGQETRFGPLVDAEGLTLDEAAEAAWEAGYFPESQERPDINQFLDALRETYDGAPGRRFLPDDYPQLDAFDAMRAERYDLEQAQFESDVPLYQDQSGAAGERPFPLVEAYQDWAGDAIERVGNIDVTKLDTPQDIKRALKTTYGSMGGFDASTRGRISQGETELLAKELGMTADNLLSRRKGQAFNAEQAMAARQILAKSGNELVNAARRIRNIEDPGEDLLAGFRESWMRHVAIQEQVAGMTAEAGRTLQQFRMSANSRAVTSQVLDAFVRSGGGRDDLKDAADVLIDAVEMGPGQFNALARDAAKAKWRDKIGELYINSLLSNPPTHIVNMVSNTLTSFAQIPEYALASGIGAGRRAVVGEKAAERILGSEVGARAFGLAQGAREGLSLFARALRTGDADDFVSKVEGDQYKAISGLKGEAIRLPTRFLTAEDQFFKGIARRMEINALAVRQAQREGLTGEARKARIAELSQNPTDAMIERSMEYGRYLTFQQKLGPFGQGISNATSSYLPAKIVAPFVRTPMNLLKFATERSPAAPLLSEWRADFRAGGDRRDLAVAKMTMGTGLATLFFDMAKDGLITGAAPPDPSKAKLMYADGWQPYSFKIGDRYISYSRLDPFSTQLGVAADMATLPQNMTDKQRENQATMLTASIMNNLASKTWLSGVSSLVEGISDPARYADNWIERIAGSMAVPAGVAGVARSVDPVMRDPQSVGQAIQGRLPGMRDGLMARRDVFGEPIQLDSLGPDFLSPFWQSKAQDDPVIAELLAIEKGIGVLKKQFSEDGERLEYSPDVYDRYQEIAGRLTYNNLLALFGSQPYSRMSDKAKRAASKKAIANARKTARSVLDDPDYPLPAKGEVQPAADPWEGFPDTDAEQEDPWAGFPDAGEL